MINFSFIDGSGFPKLGWVASFDRAQNSLQVMHGESVEVNGSWCVEGVWDGEFDLGEFYLSENFFGSGVAVLHDKLVFAPSSATVDRICYCEIGNCVVVSNSLVLLLSAIDGRLMDRSYKNEINSICKGIDGFERKIPVEHAEVDYVQQVIHENLVLSGDEIRFESRSKRHNLDSFDDYEGRLKQVLKQILSNVESPSRRKEISTYSTISRGYDSTAVTALVKDLGVDTGFTCPRSNSPWWMGKSASSDDGTPIASALGMSTIHIGTGKSIDHETETLFLAGTALAPELVFHDMCNHIERHDDVAVVFTGYHGDKLWDVSTSGRYTSDQIVRGDVSGIGLTEARLKSGFINLPITFIFARDIEDIVKISNSTEMQAWRMNNSYDRPIPRRILELAGVPRKLFGMRKKAVLSNNVFPMSRELKTEYIDFLRKGTNWSRAYVRAMELLQAASYYYDRVTTYLRSKNADSKSGKPVRFLGQLQPEERRFSWAVNRACLQLTERTNIQSLLNGFLNERSTMQL